MSKIEVRSPSNIAIVKYMGKKASNIPENGSLSLTLSRCSTQSTIYWGASYTNHTQQVGANRIRLISKDPSWVSDTLVALEKLRSFGEGQSEFPALITMDTGPNVHFLVEEKNAMKARAFLATNLSAFQILEEESGIGPVIEIS